MQQFDHGVRSLRLVVLVHRQQLGARFVDAIGAQQGLGVARVFAGHAVGQRQHELNIKLEALTDNTLIYRMWADEFGTPFDKSVMQFHYAVQAFGETVERFTKQ